MRVLTGARARLMRHVDEILALVVLVWGVTATLVRHAQNGSLGLNLALVAALSVALLVRRRAPLGFIAVTFGLAVMGAIWLNDPVNMSWSVYLRVVPAYTVGAFLELQKAALGLAIGFGGAVIIDLLQRHVLTNLVFTTVVTVAAWMTGRAMRHRRLLAAELHDRAMRVAAEREDRGGWRSPTSAHESRASCTPWWPTA